MHTSTDYMEQPKTDEWFARWFNTPYYYTLYSNRDFAEAERFLGRLMEHLDMGPQHRVLDLACGKGRHAIFLNSRGLDVVGLDISPESIRQANAQANARLHFYVHDMREAYSSNAFDFVLNVFTSFGYFTQEADDLAAVQAMAEALKPGGRLVLDFFNTRKVLASLPVREQVERGGISFDIHKHLQGKQVVKDIRFEDVGTPYHFAEYVQALTEEDFRRYFQAAGLEVEQLLGDYSLQPFEPETSDRMIFVCRKA